MTTTPTEKVRAALVDSRAVFERLKHGKPEDHIYHLLHKNCVAAESALEGMVLVPVEPTIEMRDAAVKLVDGPWDVARFDIHDAEDVYKLMIAPYVKGD